MSRLSERIENYNRAFEILEDAVNEFEETKILSHMALVQSFEVCFELAWKCIKDYMDENGIITNYPKEVIKEAFNKNTIKDAQLWLDMLEARNATSNEYNIVKVNKYLLAIRTTYFEELCKLKTWLGGLS